MNNKGKIKEIFASIQGEGLLVGVQQIFIRFCGCNLNCNYCDTDFSSSYKEYSPDELVEYLKNNFDFKTINSVSLTGGEPLLSIDFLKEFLPKLDLPVYLETNGTVYKNLEDIIDKIDYISADIKLPSCSGVQNSFDKHKLFFDKIQEINSNRTSENHFCYENKNIFAKVVFDKNITDEEIKNTVELAKKYNFEIILQPKMIETGMSINSEFIQNIFGKFLSLYNRTRVIPQVHKFLDVE